MEKRQGQRWPQQMPVRAGSLWLTAPGGACTEGLRYPRQNKKKPQLKLRLDNREQVLWCALRNSLEGIYSFLLPHSFVTEPFAMKQTQLEGSSGESSGLLANSEEPLYFFGSFLPVLVTMPCSHCIPARRAVNWT